MIKCPKCGVISTDKDFDEGNEKLAIWTDNKGINNCECWECEHKWKELSGEKG